MAMLLLHSAVLSVAPGHEFVETSDLVVGDDGKRLGQPGLRVDTVKLGGFQECLLSCSERNMPFPLSLDI